MAALSPGEKARLLLAFLAGAVLVLAIVMGMWLTTAAMVLVIVGQVCSVYGGRRMPRS